MFATSRDIFYYSSGRKVISIWWVEARFGPKHSLMQKSTSSYKEVSSFSKEDIHAANRHMKRCSVLLREKCKSKPQGAIMLYQAEWVPSKNLQGINAGESVEKREPSYTVSGHMNWCSHCGKQYGGSYGSSSYRANIWSNNPLLCIYLKKMKTLIWKDMCILICIAALFTITKTQKQPKCPSTDEWIKKIWCAYTMEY